MTRKPIPSIVRRSLAVSLLLVPPVLLAILVRRDAVNVPYWDEWDDDIAGIFVKSGHEQLTFGDLWAQHTESRMLLPRIFFLLLGKWTHWNLGHEIAATFLLACVIAAAVFWLGRLAFQGRPSAHWPVFFLSSLMIFSPVQAEAWLWGLEGILYVPLACILFSLLVRHSRTKDKVKWLLGAVLAGFSTCTFSNGLLVWVVLFPVLFLAEGWRGLRAKKWAALGWLAGFLASGLVYFHDYQFPPSHGFWHKLWTDPYPLAHYFFAFLGGSLSSLGRSVAVRDASSCLAIATMIGCILLVVFIICGCCAFKWRKDSVLMERLWPWLTIGGYGILSAALATSGRALVFGAEQALSPRYGIFGICLMVAVVHLVPLLAFHQPPADQAAKRAAAGMVTGLSMLGAIVAGFFLLVLPPQISDMNALRLDRLQAKSCLDFIKILPEQPAMKQLLFPRYPQLRRTAEALDQLKVFGRPLLTTPQISHFQKAELYGTNVCGTIEFCWQLPDAKFELAGWAVSAFQPEPADCVLLTCETSNTAPVVFGLMDQRVLRRDLAAKSRDQNFLLAGWLAVCDATNLPKGTVKIRAWAYDVDRRAIAPLQNAISLENK